MKILISHIIKNSYILISILRFNTLFSQGTIKLEKCIKYLIGAENSIFYEWNLKKAKKKQERFINKFAYNEVLAW